jgi:hypothetical protein
MCVPRNHANTMRKTFLYHAGMLRKTFDKILGAQHIKETLQSGL